MLASESKTIVELEVYNLNFMSTNAFFVKDMKKLMKERNSFLKKNKDLLDSNTKLETSISTHKSDLGKSNLSLQLMIIGKSKFDEILGAQIMQNKYQEFGFV